jgi:hypothetical protein
VPEKSLLLLLFRKEEESSFLKERSKELFGRELAVPVRGPQ